MCQIRNDNELNDAFQEAQLMPILSKKTDTCVRLFLRVFVLHHNLKNRLLLHLPLTVLGQKYFTESLDKIN